MRTYTIFNQMGEIERVVDCPESVASLQPGDGESILEGRSNDATQYVDTSTLEIKDKPELPATIDKLQLTADGVDYVTISNLPTTEPNGNPISSFVYVGGREYEVTDGQFEFGTDTPGTYVIVCRATNYLEKTFTVEAT